MYECDEIRSYPEQLLWPQPHSIIQYVGAGFTLPTYPLRIAVNLGTTKHNKWHVMVLSCLGSNTHPADATWLHERVTTSLSAVGARGVPVPYIPQHGVDILLSVSPLLFSRPEAYRIVVNHHRYDGASLCLYWPMSPSIVIYGSDIGGLYYGVTTFSQMVRLSAIEAAVCGTLILVHTT